MMAKSGLKRRILVLFCALYICIELCEVSNASPPTNATTKESPTNATTTESTTNPTTTESTTNPTTTESTTNATTTESTTNATTTESTTNPTTTESTTTPTTTESTTNPTTESTTNATTTESTTNPTTTESTTNPTTTESTTNPTTTESTTNPTTESTTNPTTTESTTNPTTESTTNATTTESTTNPTTESTTNPTTTESTTNPTTESTTNATTTESTTNPTTESTTNPTTESTTNPTTESTTNPTTTESTTNPTTESTTNPTTESTTNPTTTESTTNPTTESTTNPTTESTTNPTTESTTNPTTESTTNPTTESTTNPTTESTTNATTESTTNPTTESTTNATTTESTTNGPASGSPTHTTAPPLSNSTATSKSTSPDLAPTTPAANFTTNVGDLTVNVAFTIKFTNRNFTSNLHIKSSEEYQQLKADYEKTLAGVFNRTGGFKSVTVTRFWYGSLGVDYDAEYQLLPNIGSKLKNDSSLKESLKRLTGVDTNYVENVFDSELNEAVSLLKKVEENACNLDPCPKNWDCNLAKKGVWCKNPCADVHCNSGECVLNVDGKPMCKCPPDSTYVYGGDRCEVKAEKLSMPSTTIIAIACGVGGGLVLILIIALTVTCCRRRKRGRGMKMKGFDDQKSDVSFQSMTGMHPMSAGPTEDAGRLYRQPGEEMAVASFTRQDTGLPMSTAPAAHTPGETQPGRGSQMHYGEDGRVYRVMKDSQLYNTTEASHSFRNQAYESFPEEPPAGDRVMSKVVYHRPSQRSSREHLYTDLDDGMSQTFMYQPSDVLPRAPLILTHLNPVAAVDPDELSGFPRLDDVGRQDEVRRFSEDRSSRFGLMAAYSGRPRENFHRDEHPGAPVKVYPDREVKAYPAKDPVYPSREADYPARDPLYAGRDRAFPAKEADYPRRELDYPAKDSVYAGRDRAYPPKEADHPRRELDYPARVQEYDHPPGSREYDHMGHEPDYPGANRSSRELAYPSREREEVNYAKLNKTVLPGQTRVTQNPLIHDFSDKESQQQPSGMEKWGPADRGRVYDYVNEGKLSIQRPVFSNRPLY